LRSVELIELLENLKGYYGPTVRIYLRRGGDNLFTTATTTAESSAVQAFFGPESCNSNTMKFLKLKVELEMLSLYYL
jgi:hypothetical protein